MSTGDVAATWSTKAELSAVHAPDAFDTEEVAERRPLGLVYDIVAEHLTLHGSVSNTTVEAYSDGEAMFLGLTWDGLGSCNKDVVETPAEAIALVMTVVKVARDPDTPMQTLSGGDVSNIPCRVVGRLTTRQAAYRRLCPVRRQCASLAQPRTHGR